MSMSKFANKEDMWAHEITEELFRRDSVPGTAAPQLLGGDLCDPDQEGIKRAIYETLLKLNIGRR